MKKMAYTLAAFVLMALGSCQDEVVDNEVLTPAPVGGEIPIGSSLQETLTRTVYGDEPIDGAYPVYWEKNNGDTIAIYCPQASNRQLVKYYITPDATDSTHSSAVTKINPDEAGLQWGEGIGENGTHHFYGFYPASAVTGTEDGLIRGHIPTTQNVVRWNVETEGDGTTYYGVANTDYAYMWAYGSFDRETMGGKDVPLTFHPWNTVLEIEVHGPTSGSMKVSNINVRATTGSQTVLTGDFVCNMKPVEENSGQAPSYEAVGGSSEVRNTISITCWNPETDDFIELGPNDKLIVRAFLLPIDEGIPDARALQVRVQPLNGAVLTRSLGQAGVEGGVQPHKVNKVILPPLNSTGTNYWMTSIDPGVYLSELSIPGSKFSYLYGDNVVTDGTRKAAFQGNDILTQFKDGVRAFIIQVGANAKYEATQGTYHPGGWFQEGYYDYTYDYTEATMPIYCGGGDELSNAIAEIAGALDNADTEYPGNHECAVVMITYAGGEHVKVEFTGDDVNEHSKTDIPGTDDKIWMDALGDVLTSLGGVASNRIYTDEITANTTLDDVKGHIILKVNTNSDVQAGYLAADATVPALFSRWNGAMNTVDLQWGTLNPATQRQKLQWMYQEATHVGTNTEITPANKIAYAEDIFTNSITAYQNNSEHDTWFMNDCGGTFHGVVSGAGSYSQNYGDGDTNSEAPINLARWINPQITQFLQERGNNAALGLVFFNFADKQAGSGAEYGTDNLIQTVIDNNFKFNLRKEGSSETPEPTPSTQADAAFAKGENVWQ